MDSSINPLLRWLLAIGIAVLSIRLISLGFYPLYDTTEARYGEIARLMLETGNWVTPLFDYNVPFWGKPPLQTWISAASFGILGVNEFAARLPHFLCTLVTILLTYRFANQYFGTRRAVISIIVLSASIGFTITAGTVMTDSALLMAITLAMISFWRCFQENNSTINGLLFFAALSLGMLIKGPVAVVIIGIALTVWSVSQRCFVIAISSLPWGKGLLLFIVLTLPWYLWAEIRTPGFLEYFIVGEHIQRFLVSGWQGDLYGTAHKEPRGMIWLFWVGAAFPWSLLLMKQFMTSVAN
ncbi:MAG: ArnT family glycosyltransferase, partial [Psychrobium sp.]